MDTIEIKNAIEIENYNIRLTGAKVEDGNIPIEDYLEYLNGINKICKSANDILNPNTNLEIKINSNIEKGSIINNVDFLVYGCALFATTQLPYSINDILDIIGFIGDGFSLIKLLLTQKDNTIKSIIEIDNEHCRVEFEGKNTEKAYIEVAKSVIELYKNKRVRQDLEQSTKILKKEGFNSLGFKKASNKEYKYLQ